jgi:hypothetical protein
MCSNPYDRPPSPNAFIRNLQQPMPFARKVTLLVKNGTLKVVRLKSCCGNYGQPGC